MALKATICRAELQVSDMDRGYYASHSLQLAQQPSETDQRLMLRIALFALYAHEQLDFGKGISTDDEPDLWQTHYNGTIERWIDLGQPSDKRLRKACGRADKVVIANYDERAANMWWKTEQANLRRFSNLTVIQLGNEAAIKELPVLLSRNMELNATIQEGELWLGNTEHSIQLQINPREFD